MFKKELHRIESRPPKGGLVRGHDKPIHGGCAIYLPGGVNDSEFSHLLCCCPNVIISFQLHHPTNLREVLRAAEAPCGLGVG